MPHRFKTVEQSDEGEIRTLLGTLDKGNPVGDAAALQALKEIIEQPEADRLSPEVLDAIRATLAAAGIVFTNGEEPGGAVAEVRGVTPHANSL